MRAGHRSQEHVGEWKLSLWADSLPELFAEGARVIARETGPRSPATRRDGCWETVRLTGPDDATLLVDWLNELLGRSEARSEAYDEVRIVAAGDGRLVAEIRGRPVRSWRSALKAATYHGLTLKRDRGRWKATILFDV